MSALRGGGRRREEEEREEEEEEEEGTAAWKAVFIPINPTSALG